MINVFDHQYKIILVCIQRSLSPAGEFVKTLYSLLPLKKPPSKITNKKTPYIILYYLLPQKRKKGWTKTPLKLLFVAHLAVFTQL